MLNCVFCHNKHASIVAGIKLRFVLASADKAANSVWSFEKGSI